MIENVFFTSLLKQPLTNTMQLPPPWPFLLLVSPPQVEQDIFDGKDACTRSFDSLETSLDAKNEKDACSAKTKMILNSMDKIKDILAKMERRSHENNNSKFRNNNNKNSEI